MGANDLSFSFSRYSSFKSCPRQYYLNYYGGRNGWFKNSSPEAQAVYFLKKLTGIYAWAGNIAHEIIEFALKEYRDKGKLYTLDELTDMAYKKMKSQFLESQERVKRKAEGDFYSYKMFGLMEHNYGQTIPRTRRESIWERVKKCLSNFFSSQIWEEIKSSDISQWKSIEEFSTYKIPVNNDYSVKVFSVPDFAFMKDGKVHIYDWKTGKPKDAYKTQLSLYAVYASKYWNVKPEDVVCKIFYLLSNEVHDVDVSEETIAGVTDTVKNGTLAMIEKLQNKDPVKNEALSKEDFPLTKDTSTCYFCQYSEVCGIKDK